MAFENETNASLHGNEVALASPIEEEMRPGRLSVFRQLWRAASHAVQVHRHAEKSSKQLETVIKSTLRPVETETAAHARQLEAIFEAITDQVLVYDSQRQVIRTNAAARQFNALMMQPGYSARPAQERFGPYQIRDENDRLLSEEQIPIVRILKGEVLTSTNAEDVRLSLPNGRDVQLSVTGAPIKDAQGNITGGVLICRDVTERRQLERRTQEALEALLVIAEELLLIPESAAQTIVTEQAISTANPVAQHLVELIRSVLGCQRVSITAVDPETQAFRSVAVVGLTHEQEQQWRARQAGFHLSEQFSDRSIDARLQTGEVLVLDLTQPSFSNRPNPFGIRQMLLAPMTVGKHLVGMLSVDYGGKEHCYSQNEITHVGAVAKLAALVIEHERLVHEKTEAQTSALAFQEANRQMDEFMGIASHELKTPLTTIKGNIQLAQRHLKGIVKQEAVPLEEVASKLTVVQGFLERAERQIGVQNRLVNDLLDVSRIHVNRLELHIELCDLATIVREAVEDQRYVVSPRTIGLEMEASEVFVMADADRLGQVVNNYLSNALKYSEATYPVEVRLEKAGPAARVSVRDQGPGLSPAEQERIWERFYRAEGVSVKSGSGVGLGLGLHICRTIIERQGGQVGVESMPGHGSSFWFTLPLAEPVDTGADAYSGGKREDGK